MFLFRDLLVDVVEEALLSCRRVLIDVSACPTHIRDLVLAHVLVRHALEPAPSQNLFSLRRLPLLDVLLVLVLSLRQDVPSGCALGMCPRDVPSGCTPGMCKSASVATARSEILCMSEASATAPKLGPKLLQGMRSLN